MDMHYACVAQCGRFLICFAASFFFSGQPCRNTAVQLCYAARHINTANAVLVVFDCASQAIFGLIFLKNKGPIEVRRMLADWWSSSYPVKANFRIETMNVWAYRKAQALHWTFGRDWINRKIELTRVELTQVYCTHQTCQAFLTPIHLMHRWSKVHWDIT